MEQAQHLLAAFWEPFSFLSLFAWISGALLLGTVAGLVLAILLHRGGWLARSKRWHHWTLKLYFLLLPLVGGVLGFQGGLLYSGQQQINRHLDSYAPAVQRLADDTWQDFQAYVAAQDEHQLQALRGSSVQAALNQLALEYLRSEQQEEADARAEASLAERLALDLLDRLRASLIGKAVGQMAVSEAASYSGLDKRVLAGVLDARVEQLFQAEFLLDLLKRQVGHVFKPFFIALLLQLGLLLAFIAGEWAVSRWLRQIPSAVRAEPAALA
ncbi:hypothetical protein [Metapseudomonas otitidis]|uniref:hypothetical protein n=1 Tax=Metapseudomonas otitidis TaxID=319939 RepID=UPI00209B8FE7|nr:hypothetical protein [Pseudomonas otitidis]MCO7557196.1 hypothetical protein [Pseudomonas otitidis]